MNSTLSVPTVKYTIKAKLEVEGVVEKPDIIGAIFGQTEGLFGPDLDLRELQRNSKVGRIEVEVKSDRNRTLGRITVTSSLNKASTAIMAAAIESIDRVGPCGAKVAIEKIEDIRVSKRKQIVHRAKELLKKWTLEETPETDELLREIMDSLRPCEISSYGADHLHSGPDVHSSKELIVVEGRADVGNLLRCGIRNVIAIGGARVPETVVKLSEDKEVTAFLDGDRAGDLILKELTNVVKLNYVTRAPPGKEVEDLTCKEILSALEKKVPIEEAKVKHARITTSPKVTEEIGKLRGTLEATLFNEAYELIAKVPVSELTEKLSNVDDAVTVVFDGIITQRLVDLAADKNVKYLIGERVSDVVKRPSNLRLITFNEIAPDIS
jgi:DNA primase